jgi:hypothetical protein
MPPGEGKLHCLERFDRRIRHVTRNRGLKLCAALLVWLWFHITLIGRYAWEEKRRNYR